ncbi:MAG: tRNA (adenosine(37)-N6)-threonylcarbamoyltransferase complex ATPase subunit type 1 TsaE [Pirellulaceae bacterium]
MVELPTLDATCALAVGIAQYVTSLPSQISATLALQGTLGMGKTQWARYFCQALGVPAEVVTSPTYVLLQRYGTAIGKRIYHFDFYRLESAAHVWDLGIDELFEQPSIILIEWADKFPECLPMEYLRIEFGQSAVNDTQRRRAQIALPASWPELDVRALAQHNASHSSS